MFDVIFQITVIILLGFIAFGIIGVINQLQESTCNIHTHTHTHIYKQQEENDPADFWKTGEDDTVNLN